MLTPVHEFWPASRQRRALGGRFRFRRRSGRSGRLARPGASAGVFAARRTHRRASADDARRRSDPKVRIWTGYGLSAGCSSIKPIKLALQSGEALHVSQTVAQPAAIAAPQHRSGASAGRAGWSGAGDLHELGHLATGLAASSGRLRARRRHRQRRPSSPRRQGRPVRSPDPCAPRTGRLPAVSIPGRAPGPAAG